LLPLLLLPLLTCMWVLFLGLPQLLPASFTLKQTADFYSRAGLVAYDASIAGWQVGGAKGGGGALAGGGGRSR
jgi:hypothetical protein